MKLRNFANKFLLIAVLVVVSWGQLFVGYTPVALVLSPQDEGAVTKSYYLDQYNEDADTEQTVYDLLGIKVYNDYLAALDASQGLQDVVIAVVDTGLNPTHPVFANRVLSEYAVNFSQGISDSTVLNQWNNDLNGHGTHVAGLIADMTLDNVKILPIKIFHGHLNNMDDYSFENAVRYLCALKTGKTMKLIDDKGYETGTCNKNKVKLNIIAVNLSLGTDGYNVKDSEAMADFEKDKYGYKENGIEYSGYQDVVDLLIKYEMLPIVAAGNLGSSESKTQTYYSLPGACDGVLAVSAYDNTDKTSALASFSYHNDFVSIAAPGVEIWSACSQDIADLLSNSYTDVMEIEEDEFGEYAQYKYYYNPPFNDTVKWFVRQDEAGNYYMRSSGTSMATPYVTACYAMLMSDVAKASAEDFGLSAWDGEGADQHYMSYAHKALLAAAATYGDKKVAGYDEYFGYGIVSVQGFHQADAIPTLVEIQYEGHPSEDYQNAEPSGAKVSDKEIDWFFALCVLGGGSFLVWILGIFKSYLTNRRKTHDSNGQ